MFSFEDYLKLLERMAIIQMYIEITGFVINKFSKIYNKYMKDD